MEPPKEVHRQEWVEMRSCEAEHYSRSLLEIKPVLIDPLGPQCVEAIRNHGHITAEVRFPSGRYPRVAGNIVTHVVLQCRQRRQTRDIGLTEEICRTACGVTLHLLPFFSG